MKKARRARTVSANRLDRLPPHSVESEQGVLGCVLLSPNDCLGLCVEKIKAGNEAFYDLRHQTIYAALVEMYDQREAVDVITLQQKLKDRQLLDQIGGIPYLNFLQDEVPSAANLSYYLDIVLEKSLLRKMINTCTDVVGRIYDYEGEAYDLLDEVEREVLKIGADRVSDSGDAQVKQLVQDSIKHMEVMFESKGAILGVAHGFADLDGMTGGMHGGDMIVLSGYPSTGKTSLAMNIVENVVLVQGLSALVFTYEMSPQSLVTRFICTHARVNLRNVAKGYICETDFPKLISSSGKVSASKLHIVKASGMNIGQLRAKARRIASDHGVKLIVIDYLQKIPSDRKTEKRSDAVALVSNGVKDLAMELDVPVLVLSQLNNEGGLFMSSETGMDADAIYKLKADKEKSDWNAEGGVEIALAVEKQRNGPTGVVPLVFLRQFTRFESAAKVADGDVPDAGEAAPRYSE